MRYALAVLAVLWLAAPTTTAAERPTAEKPAEGEQEPRFRPTKQDLAASYRPHRIHGVDWYRTVGAGRTMELRKKRAPGEERLILQMRMLGPLDGAT